MTPLALTARARAAIEAGGLRFDPPSHAAYLTGRRAVARSVADRIIRRLEESIGPDSPIEFALLDGVPTMAAFACTATDCVYRMMARGFACRDDVRMAFSQFIVSSAAFDYICDDAPELFPELAARITEDRLRRALTDPNGAPDISRPGSPLVAYVSALFDDQVALWWRIAARSDPSGGLRLPAVLTAMVVDLFRAEIRSRPADSPTPDPDDSRAVIWRDPLWMACQLVAATSDVDPSADLDDIRRRTESAGRLFALIDDVVDFEHDWRTGSRNRLIDAVRETAASPQNTPPSEAALSEEVVGPYMKEITTLVAELSDPSLRDDVGGWLHSWLEP